jgi:hypothetical protein
VNFFRISAEWHANAIANAPFQLGESRMATLVAVTFTAVAKFLAKTRHNLLWVRLATNNMSTPRRQINLHADSLRWGGNLSTERRDDPRLAAGLFFALPAKLIDEIERHVGGDKIATADFQFEREVSASLTAQQIGVWRGNYITSSCLGEPPSAAPPIDNWSSLGVPDQDLERVRNALDSSQADRDRIRTALAAYVGWLLTTPQFIREHDELLQGHRTTIAAVGLPTIGNFNLAKADPQVFAAGKLEMGRVEDNLERLCTEDFKSFFIRWRLTGLNAPYVPEPIGPQFPVLDPQRMSDQMAEGGLTLYLPDTAPTPGRDELRELVEQALGRHSASSAAHLRGWREIIASESKARNQLARYARIARLQHYWTAIQSRYAEQLGRSKGKVMEAVANYLGVEPKTIARDLDLISERFSYAWPRPYHAAV